MPQSGATVTDDFFQIRPQAGSLGLYGQSLPSQANKAHLHKETILGILTKNSYSVCVALGAGYEAQV
jgi:hypothetical protein